LEWFVRTSAADASFYGAIRAWSDGAVPGQAAETAQTYPAPARLSKTLVLI
jgi:hypothetical protein